MLDGLGLDRSTSPATRSAAGPRWSWPRVAGALVVAIGPPASARRDPWRCVFALWSQHVGRALIAAPAAAAQAARPHADHGGTWGSRGRCPPGRDRGGRGLREHASSTSISPRPGEPGSGGSGDRGAARPSPGARRTACCRRRPGSVDELRPTPQVDAAGLRPPADAGRPGARQPHDLEGDDRHPRRRRSARERGGDREAERRDQARDPARVPGRIGDHRVDQHHQQGAGGGPVDRRR